MKTGDLLFPYPMEDGTPYLLGFWCPACQEEHHFTVAAHPNRPQAPVWSFDGNYKSPTFSPSLRYLSGTQCHLFVSRGQIEYCGDCPHEYAGKTVPMVPWDESTNYWQVVLTP